MADVPETRNGPGWVVMTHPSLKDKDGAPVYAEVTAEALEQAYKPRGWVEAKSTKSAAKVGA